MLSAPPALRFRVPVCLLAGVLFTAVPAAAQQEESDPHAVGAAPYVYFAIGNVVDTAGTLYGKAHGNIELDPALNGGTARIITVKVASSLAFAAVMKLFADHGHAKVAKILGYVGGSVTLGAGVNNVRIVKPQRDPQ